MVIEVVVPLRVHASGWAAPWNLATEAACKPGTEREEAENSPASARSFQSLIIFFSFRLATYWFAPSMSFLTMSRRLPRSLEMAVQLPVICSTTLMAALVPPRTEFKSDWEQG